MAWERRKRGGRYYTRSRRVGPRVVRDYLGCGPLAELASAVDLEGRKEREAHRAGREREQAPLRAVQDALRLLAAGTDELTTVTLEAAGYHRHHGEWRRRRGR